MHKRYRRDCNKTIATVNDYFAQYTTHRYFRLFRTKGTCFQNAEHAPNFEETAYLAEFNEDYEHRENGAWALAII